MLLRAALAVMLLAVPARAELPIQAVTSPGGLTAWLIEDHSIPFMALELRFEGGTNLDAPGKRGAVNLMAALLEEGTGDLDSQAFAEAREALAADFSFEAGRDTVSVSARMLTENRDVAVDLLRGAVAAPRFDDASIERVRGQVLSNIAGDEKDPDAIAGRVFARLAYGDHPYGSPSDGTADSVTGLTRDDLVAAYKASMARDRVFIAAAGDITPADLGLMIDRILGDLPATGAVQPPQVGWTLASGVTVEDFPVPQSVVLFGQSGIKRDDPDFFAAYILNEIVGGSRFGTRLMTELREKRGLTYGAYSYLVPRDLSESWQGQFSTDNATAGQAVALVRDEWAKIAADGITAEELAKTKTYLTGSYPLRFEGNGPIAGILVGMQLDRLPIDYATTRNAQIEAVTLEDIRRVAARLMKPEELHFVVVGQPQGIDTQP